MPGRQTLQPQENTPRLTQRGHPYRLAGLASCRAGPPWLPRDKLGSELKRELTSEPDIREKKKTSTAEPLDAREPMLGKSRHTPAALPRVLLVDQPQPRHARFLFSRLSYRCHAESRLPFRVHGSLCRARRHVLCPSRVLPAAHGMRGAGAREFASSSHFFWVRTRVRRCAPTPVRTYA